MTEKNKKTTILQALGITAMVALFFTAFILSAGCCPWYS
jgi:hypothetical protein